MASENRSEPGTRRRGRPPKPITPRKSPLSRLGRALRQVREADGLSLVEFADWSEYSAGHLSRVERGEATPSRELIEAYENRFHADGLLRSLYRMVLDDQQAARLARRGASDRSAAPQEPPPRTQPRDRSEFVDDLAIRDGAIVGQGEHVVKSWRIRNVGSVPWRERFLERVGASSGPAIVTSPHRVPIRDTMPGESVDISVDLVAPELPGSTIAYWQMVDGAGRPCFPDRYADALYAELVVKSSAS